jgi:acyl-coenzyme A thioesterase PaaI-like protein
MTVLPAVEVSVDHVTVADDYDEDNDDNNSRHNSATESISSSHLPDWVHERRESWGDELVVPEWEHDDGTYRTKHGWHGRDLVHDNDAPVRVMNYYVRYGRGIDGVPSSTSGGNGTTLVGVAHFTRRSESHRGYCHGGSMCSLLDDVIGWVAFLVTGECRPWTGFTVQVNSSLRRPIPVDSVLLVRATITNVVRRKVSVEAAIVDPDDDDAVHATGSGLVIINRGVLPDGGH